MTAFKVGEKVKDIFTEKTGEVTEAKTVSGFHKHKGTVPIDIYFVKDDADGKKRVYSGNSSLEPIAAPKVG